MTKIVLIEDDTDTAELIHISLKQSLRGSYENLLVATSINEGQRILQEHNQEKLLIICDGSIGGKDILALKPLLQNALTIGSEMIQFSKDINQMYTFIDTLRLIFSDNKFIPQIPKDYGIRYLTKTIEKKLIIIKTGIKDDLTGETYRFKNFRDEVRRFPNMRDKM